MTTKGDESVLVFGAGVILTHLNALQQEIEGVREAQDIEYVHRMRVASRRLRNAISLFAKALPPKKLERWQSSLRRVTKDLGAVRDLDVQILLVEQLHHDAPSVIYKPGLDRLFLRLNQKRTRLQIQVLQSLAALEGSDTLESISKTLSPYLIPPESTVVYPKNLYELAFRSIVFRLDTFLSYEPYINSPECSLELHAMRIAGKHLRYTLETFAPLYGDEVTNLLPTLRKIQDKLGEIHDSDVWVTSLPAFINKERQKTIHYYGNQRMMGRLMPGLNYFMQNRQENRNHNYLEFVDLWQTLKVDRTWGKLREIITTSGTPPKEAPLPPGMPAF